MVSGETGKTLAYALDNLQQRGRLYIPANTEVYAGMVIGDTSKGDDMTVNPIKGKKLTNMRAAGSDDNVILAPPYILTLERGLEVMVEDDYLEIISPKRPLKKEIPDRE